MACVDAHDPLLAITAGAGGSGRGSGGMASKLEAARIASWSGVPTVIANAARADVLRAAVRGDRVGTRFEARKRHLGARKLWIAFAARSAGTITVDAGARRALTERSTSLLPAGVVGVEGQFAEGDTVEVHDVDGHAFARGMVSVEASRLRKVAGLHTSELPADMAHEVIHRDALVVLPTTRPPDPCAERRKDFHKAVVAEAVRVVEWSRLRRESGGIAALWARTGSVGPRNWDRRADRGAI